MTDQLTIHAATLIRLDVTTNALRNLLAMVQDLRADDAFDLTVIADAHAALEIAQGSRSDMPHSIRSQRMPHDLAQRFLDEGCS